mmetsp:Transcript_11471/g.18375  ORF Transcript_11471/g.18375 Transcript_11471/m.18375 type:complete len:246 (+) Transcript_11471:561-1298(+)
MIQRFTTMSATRTPTTASTATMLMEAKKSNSPVLPAAVVRSDASTTSSWPAQSSISFGSASRPASTCRSPCACSPSGRSSKASCFSSAQPWAAPRAANCVCPWGPALAAARSCAGVRLPPGTAFSCAGTGRSSSPALIASGSLTSVNPRACTSSRRLLPPAVAPPAPAATSAKGAIASWSFTSRRMSSGATGATGPSSANLCPPAAFFAFSASAFSTAVAKPLPITWLFRRRAVWAKLWVVAATS